MLIVIFDDEKIFCEKLQLLVENFFEENYRDFGYSIKTFTDNNELIMHIHSNTPELIFLDISIPKNENCGIEIAKRIRSINIQCHIVFITSQKDKINDALDGLIRPSQFLIKPIDKNQLDYLMQNILDSIVNSKDYITVRYGRYEYIINSNDICYIQKEGRKTVISLINRKIEITNTIASIAEKLPEQFMFIDKGVVVNLKMVKSVDYTNKCLILNNDLKVYMSRNSKPIVKNALEEMIGCV